MLLLLEQPLLQCLLEKRVRCRRWVPTLCGLGALGWLLPSTRPCITPWKGSHVILLLHLEMVLVLEPLLECSCGLLLSNRSWVTLSLLTWGTTGLLRAKRWTSRWTLPHCGRLHPLLSHESLPLWRLWLLELTMIYSHLLLLQMFPHEQLSKLRAI